MAAAQPQMPSAQAIGVQLGATPPGGEGNLLAPQTTTQQAVDALTFDWNESMVNRQKNGRFGPIEGPDKGGGNGGGSPAKSKSGKNAFKGFAKTRLKEHAQKHMQGVGAKTEKEHSALAKLFGSQPVGGNIVGTKDKRGNIIKYDRSKCILFVGNEQTGFIRTFMQVKGGKKEQAEKYVKTHYPDLEL